MNNFVLEIWDDEGIICSFYPVRWDIDGAALETDRFFDSYSAPQHPLQERAMELFRLITESIGNRYGATDDFFDRVENSAQAIPPKPKQYVEEIKNLGINFPLRLYCYRITEHIVVLFNGGIKDASSAQNSKDLSTKFYEAQTFVKRIEDALQSKTIEISTDKRHLQSFDGEEIIL